MKERQEFLPRELEEESKQIDKWIKKNLWGKILAWAGVIILFGPMIIFVILGKKELSFSFILGWLIIWIILLIISNKFLKLPPERKLFSYCLTKIIWGAEKKNIESKYLKLIYKNSSFVEKREIIKEDTLFQDQELRENTFNKNLSEIIERINYAQNNGLWKNLNLNNLRILARDIFYRNKEIVETSGRINQELIKKLLKTEKFPSTTDKLKKVFSKKLSKFFCLEILIGILLFILNKVKIIDFSEAKIFFVMLTVAIIYVIFKN